MAKYCLKTLVIHKLPVLKFFDTGPIDRQKKPYKSWCRVCRIELSLMSKGVLELLSHFKTDSQLAKEFPIGMKIPGKPLHDRFWKPFIGNALLEPKKVAKETYPIASPLDACRLLVDRTYSLTFSPLPIPVKK